MDRPYSEFSKNDLLQKEMGTSPTRSFSLGKLQFAGILLIIVFIWGIISAVTISMFDIHLLALTEFEDDGRADVSGFITDSEGNSLYNVTVIVHGTQYFTKTNLDGFYTMENIKEGEYEIEASLEGYGSVTKRVALDPNSPTMVNFVLEEGGFDKTINERYGSNLSDLQHLNYATAGFIIVYASFALIGGILAYFQRYYWLAMFGGLCGIISGILSIGIIIAPILSFIALYYIVRNQEEFITAERPLVDRLLGVHRTESRPVGTVKGGAGKYKGGGYAPSQIKTKASKPIPPEPMSTEFEGPSPCAACGGTVKSEAQGTTCRDCGVNYHKFCADSISICKKCGSPL
jgi:hypothetical protein